MLTQRSDLSSLPLIRHRSLSDVTTLQVGGTCHWFAEVSDHRQLEETWVWARERSIPVLFIGDGSNVVFSDRGFPGLVLKNRILGIDRSRSEVRVAGGEDLGRVIGWLNRHGLSGMERIYGVPGTLAGAVVGNAGAYGQEISDSVIEAQVWTPQEVRTLPARALGFRYRDSIFKERRNWFLLHCTLRLEPSRENLQRISDDIFERRQVKYPSGLKCPGSFFKNILARDLPQEVLQRIPEDFVYKGKIPAGKLLEAVGAKGAARGHAQFADYHANLILNRGGARSNDILGLADEYAGRVWERFGIRLEPEILIVDGGPCSHLQTLKEVG